MFCVWILRLNVLYTKCMSFLYIFWLLHPLCYVILWIYSNLFLHSTVGRLFPDLLHIYLPISPVCRLLNILETLKTFTYNLMANLNPFPSGCPHCPCVFMDYSGLSLTWPDFKGWLVKTHSLSSFTLPLTSNAWVPISIIHTRTKSHWLWAPRLVLQFWKASLLSIPALRGLPNTYFTFLLSLPSHELHCCRSHSASFDVF